MSFPLFLATLTLAPAVCALVIALLGVARRPRQLAVGVVATLGALIPIICLVILSQYLSTGLPIFAVFFGSGSTGLGASDWFSPAYRADTFGLYSALLLAVIAAPLALWMAWRGGAGAGDATPEESAPSERRLARSSWAGVSLALAAEAAALTVCFSDNVVWLGLWWFALALLVWGLGELGSAPGELDLRGLGFAAVGPLVWLAALLIPALGEGGASISARTIFPRLTDMMGRGSIHPVQTLALAAALALAIGAYPFNVWVRRRTALTTPAGVAGLALVALPLALFVAARTYSAAQDASSNWAQIGQAKPPITAGIAFMVLGAFTIAISGLLALGQREGRTLIALLASAQAGWGLLALGTGTSEGALSLLALLAVSIVGLGAMLAALLAGGALTSEIEPPSDGPRLRGAPLHPLRLAAWSIGAASLVGAPFLGGYVVRQLGSAGALHAAGLPIPLTGLAWVGDALLALALLRATAPAFLALATPRRVGDQEADAPTVDAADGDVAPIAAFAPLTRADVPAALLGLIAVLFAAAPQLALTLGPAPAAAALLQRATANTTIAAVVAGYSVGPAQAFVTLAWGAALLLAAIFMLVRPATTYRQGSVFLAGSAVAVAHAPAEEDADPFATPEPEDAWADLVPAFHSQWTQPGAQWLLSDVEDWATPLDDDADDEDEDGAAGEDDEDGASSEVAVTQPAAPAETPAKPTATAQRDREAAPSATASASQAAVSATTAPTRQATRATTPPALPAMTTAKNDVAKTGVAKNGATAAQPAPTASSAKTQGAFVVANRTAGATPPRNARPGGGGGGGGGKSGGGKSGGGKSSGKSGKGSSRGGRA